ncbi:hypothetical protein H0H93_013523 [Arthromyces matolae]|nr:hypothetical protein H0H93_013523 [Arthromyces matolae]
MKFPSSTSFVVAAALIASSSTTSFAAPATVPPGGDVSIPGHQFATSHDTNVVHTTTDKDNVKAEDAKDTKDEKPGLLSSILCPVLDILGIHCGPKKEDNAKEARSIVGSSGGMRSREAVADFVASSSQAPLRQRLKNKMLIKRALLQDNQ